MVCVISSYREGKSLFTPFNPLKILHYSDKIEKLIKNGEIPVPPMVSFDFANPCSHNCVWCAWKMHRRKEGEFMSDDVFKSAVSDCIKLGITGFEVCGGGEPLMHPHSHEYISTLGRIGNLLLVTNGSHLTIQDAYFSKTIRVSLDAATSKTHEKLHESKDFYDVIENIRNAAAVTRTGIGFLIHPDNFEEIPKIAQLGKELGCKFVHIRPCYTDNPEIKETIGYDWFKWINEKYGEVTSLIDESKEQETEDFKIYTTLYKTAPKKDWDFKKCYAAYFNPLITPSGTVWICCERRGIIESDIGTIGLDGSFIDIWFSTKHKELMDKCPNDLCPSKDKFLGYNKAIWKGYVEKKLDLDWI